MQKSILLLAYASEPGAGSEYGVGWYVPTLLAKHCPQYNVYVLTRSRCKEKIIKRIGRTSYKESAFLILRYSQMDVLQE